MTELEKLLFESLHKIAQWPDNGTKYGQQNIKRYARAQLTYAASLDSPEPDSHRGKAAATERERT